jgi:hypothetical protein
VKDELTNKSVHSLQLREMILQTDQINFHGGIEDEFTNRSTQSLLIYKMNLQTDQFNLTSQ